MAKYDPLRDWLRVNGAERVTLDFAQLEEIIGLPLPPSAVRHEQWWENEGTSEATAHAQARAWHAAGYRACADRARRRVTFTRLGAAPERSPVQAAGESLRFCGYPFRFLQRLVPHCEDGRPRLFYPRRDGRRPLNAHGAGAFRVALPLLKKTNRH